MLLKKKGLDKEINLLTKICDFKKRYNSFWQFVSLHRKLEINIKKMFKV